MKSQKSILSFIQEKHPEIREEWQLEPHFIYSNYIQKNITLEMATFFLKTIIDNYDKCGITQSIEALYLLCFISKRDKDLFKYLEEIIITNIGTFSKQYLLVSLCVFELSRLYPKKASKPLTYALSNNWGLSFNIEYLFNDADLRFIAKYVESPLKKLSFQFRDLFSKNKIKYENKELFGYYKRIIIKPFPNDISSNFLNYEYEQFTKDWNVVSIKPSKFDGKYYYDLIKANIIPYLFKKKDIKNNIEVLFNKTTHLLIISIKPLNLWLELKGIKILQIAHEKNR